MSVKPILFNTEMVRAIQNGTKTVTRRVVKLSEPGWEFVGLEDRPFESKVRADGTEYAKEAMGLFAVFSLDGYPDYPMVKSPYRRGDILYVRETWTKLVGSYIYKADQKSGMKNPGNWRPSIHMPREAARIFLRVTDVRVQRLRDVTEEEARAEGFTSRAEFIRTFLKLYPDCTEESWLWVIEFERCKNPKESG